MRSREEIEKAFDVRQYSKTQSEIRALKTQLPDKLVETLAQEVIRRMAGRNLHIPVTPPTEDDIEELCLALLSEDDDAGARFIQDLRSDGASVEAVYLTYLAGAARMLGAWWDSSRVPFTEVALGTTRMYAIMRALRGQFAIAAPSSRRSAVFASVPGETHVLGVRMATDLFRKNGWEIDLKVGKTHDELVAEISRSDAAVIGISAGGNHVVQPLSRLMVALRITNPRAWIFICGNVVDEAREAIDLMDPDGVVTDIDTALDVMRIASDKSDPPEPSA
jgi:methanogenic corrinoid protein MtbC1